MRFKPAARRRAERKQSPAFAVALDGRQLGHIHALDGGRRRAALEYAVVEPNLARLVHYMHARRIDAQVQLAAAVHDFQPHGRLRRIAVISYIDGVAVKLALIQLAQIHRVFVARRIPARRLVVAHRQHLSVTQLDNLVAVVIDEVRLVRNQHDQMLLRNRAQYFHYHERVRLVEVARRLVGEDYARVFDDCARNSYALLLPARKRVGQALGELFHAHVGERGGDASVYLVGVGHAAKPQRVFHVLVTGLFAVEVVVLENIPDIAVAQVVRADANIRAVDFHRTACEPVQPAEHVQQRGLAAPALTEQRHHAVVGQLQRHVVDYVYLVALALIEILIKLGNLNHFASPFKDFLTLALNSLRIW